MRRVMLLAIVGALGVAGVAYAAVNNTYVVNAKITPIKSGTKKSPRPISTTIGWTVGTSPAGQRPAVVKGYRVTVSGVQEHTTLFPGCSTSTLTSKSPSACPKRSKIGSGYLINQVGSSKSSSTTGNFTCRAEVSLFNGGNHDLVLYVYKGSQVSAQPA